MVPVMGLVSAGLPASLFMALRDAQERYPDAAVSIAACDGGYLIMVAQGGRVECETVPECIVNNEDLALVMAHYFEELAARMQQ